MTKEINLLGALHSSRRAVRLGLWNRVVADDGLATEVDALVAALRAKNHQAIRQIKFAINRGVECDLETAQGFETLSGGLSAAVNSYWQVPDADQGAGVAGFAQKDDLWRRRRGLAQGFWVD